MIIPNRADTHIQNNAPAPPAATAVATPAILPKPTVPPTAVQIASNGVMVPTFVSSAFAVPWKIFPTVFFMMKPKWLTWKNMERMEKYTPVPRISTRSGVPQRTPSSQPKKLIIQFSSPCDSCLVLKKRTCTPRHTDPECSIAPLHCMKEWHGSSHIPPRPMHACTSVRR